MLTEKGKLYTAPNEYSRMLVHGERVLLLPEFTIATTAALSLWKSIPYSEKFSRVAIFTDVGFQLFCFLIFEDRR